MPHHARRHPRYEVKDVEGTFLFDLEVNVLNLSLGGMAVETPHRLRVGRRYSFRIQHSGEVVNVSGTVAWSTLRATRRESEENVTPVYHAGICFEDILTEMAENLKQFIEENVVLDVGKRLLGRFRLSGRSDHTVSINSQVEFEVRKISLSGMLAESSLEARLESQFPLEIGLANGLFSATGRIAYVEPTAVDGGTSIRNQLGIEFLEVSEQDHKLLEDYITFWVEAEPPE